MNEGLNFEEKNIEKEVRKIETKIESDGQMISTTLFLPTNEGIKFPGIMFLHGWRGDKLGSLEYAKKLAGEGYACLAFDFRGHGDSDGDISELTRENFLNDAKVAYDFLVSNDNVDSNNISAVASSFGAYILAILSKDKKFKSLVLRVPADYPDDGFNEPRMQTADMPGAMDWRNLERSYDDTKALRAIHDFNGEIMIVQSEKDDMVPEGTIKSYINAVSDKNNVSRVIMEDAPHSIGRYPEFKAEFGNILSQWFLEKSDND